MEKTLCLLKPDSIRRGLVGIILHRLERTGLKIIAMKMLHATQKQAGEHYTYEDIALRHGEMVRNQLINFLTSSPIIAFIMEGDSSINVLRKICGPTEPTSAPVGTIRGDYSHHSFMHAKTFKRSIANLIHSSASTEDAKREISIWFNNPTELLAYQRNDEKEHNLSL